VPINKSVKQLVIELLRQKGAMALKDIYNDIRSERENVHEAHVRGVLNKDIQTGGKYFQRVGRGKYGLVTAPTATTKPD
jgi:hypothetical protein